MGETCDSSYWQGYTSAGQSGIGFLPQAAENKIAYARGFLACKIEDLKSRANAFLGRLELFFEKRDFGEGISKDLKINREP